MTVAVALAMLVLNAGLAFYREFTYSRLVLGHVRRARRRPRRRSRGSSFWSVMARIWASSRHRQRALVAGAGELGRMVAEKLAEHRELGLDVVGFLDDDPGKARRPLRRPSGARHPRRPRGRWRARTGVDLLYVALPLGAQHKTVRAAQERRAAPARRCGSSPTCSSTTPCAPGSRTSTASRSST